MSLPQKVRVREGLPVPILGILTPEGWISQFSLIQINI